MDGTARLLHLTNKRVLATLVHCEPRAVEEGAGAAAGGGGDGMEVDGEDEEGGGEVKEEASFSVETVGFSHVFNWCATGEFSHPLPFECFGNW